MSDRVLILGASVRAAAASARRAGLTPFGVDLFADRDTAELCEHVARCPLADYPRGLFDLARRLPPMPWFYTGGLENHPELVSELATERELWGVGTDVLRRVRDPHVLDRVPCHVATFANLVEPSAAALRKPLGGSGGGGIRFHRPGEPRQPGYYYQEYIDGEPRSAVCSAVTARSVTLGVAAQLVGTPWLHAAPFRYAGNVTRPWVDNPVYSWDWDLCQATGLRGLFGLDFIAPPTAPRGYHVVEVNPRYTASVEVHELATGVSLLRRTEPPPPAARVVGKAVYYAARPLAVPESGPWDESLRHCTDVWRRPDFADIPRPGDVIEHGQPVVTLLAEGATEAAVLATLKARAADLDRLFGVPTPEEPSP